MMAVTKKTATKPAAVKEAPKMAAEEKETKKTVTADQKEAVKAEAAVAPEKTSAPKKAETAKKASATAAKKAPAKKAATARKEIKTAVYVQYAGREVASSELVEAAKKAYIAAGHKESDIRTIDVYVKPEENTAYYAVNGEGSDEYKIEY